jgi:hypothetical protein
MTYLESQYPPSRISPAPSWLPSHMQADIKSVISNASSEFPDAAADLARWIIRSFAKRRGRPVNPALDKAYRRAWEMKNNVRGKAPSWQKITLRLCPQKGPSHKCDQACVDRIRLGAKQFGK